MQFYMLTHLTFFPFLQAGIQSVDHKALKIDLSHNRTYCTRMKVESFLKSKLFYHLETLVDRRGLGRDCIGGTCHPEMAQRACSLEQEQVKEKCTHASLNPALLLTLGWSATICFISIHPVGRCWVHLCLA